MEARSLGGSPQAKAGVWGRQLRGGPLKKCKKRPHNTFKLIGFGAVDVTKPNTCIRLGQHMRVCTLAMRSLGWPQVTYDLYLIVLCFSADNHNHNVPRTGPYVWSPRLICCETCIICKPDSFPGFPGPAADPGGPKIDRQTQTRIF